MLKIYYVVSNKVEDYPYPKQGFANFASKPIKDEIIYLGDFEFTVQSVWHEFSKDDDMYMTYLNVG